MKDLNNETKKTYVIDEGTSVVFKKYKTGDMTGCELQEGIVIGEDYLLGIGECSCCDAISYQFAYSKKKFLQVRLEDVRIVREQVNEEIPIGIIH